MNLTNIGWCDCSWPIVNGCRRISPGCERCYAERLIATRLKWLQKYVGLADMGVVGTPHWTGETRLWEPDLLAPLKRKKPARVFVADMGDLFYDGVDNAKIAAVFGVMAAAHWHTFQVLTKRPERFERWMSWLRAGVLPIAAELRTCTLAAAQILRESFGPYVGPGARGEIAWPLPNVWLGVSVESRDYLHRIDTLRETPAALRFLSLEPLLEDLGPINLAGIGWVIVGGESGPSHRECDPIWIENIVAQCRCAGVPVFVKQAAGRRPGMQGNMADWVWSLKEFPEVA